MLKRATLGFIRAMLRSVQGTEPEAPTVARFSAERIEGTTLLTDRGVLAAKLSGVGAEIGVAFGDYTKELLPKSSKLYLIDVWASRRYQDGLQKICQEFASEIDSGKIEILRGLSTERIPDIPNNSLDWCYIDTDHSYRTTKLELELILPKMKDGGRICGDDYASGNPSSGLRYGVIPAVIEFCEKHSWNLEFLTMEADRNPSFSIRR